MSLWDYVKNPTGPCQYCNAESAPHHYFAGPMCDACDAAIVAHRVAKSNLEHRKEIGMAARHDCDGDNSNADEVCRHCCDHEYDPDEGGMCLHCGTFPWD